MKYNYRNKVLPNHMPLSKGFIHIILALTFIAVTSPVFISSSAMANGAIQAPGANWFFRGVRIALVVVALIYARAVAARLARDIPVTIGVAIVCLSAIWSADPTATIAAASFLFLVVAFLAVCDATLGTEAVFDAIWKYTFGLTTISVILALSSSTYALTQLGEWRGLFTTKNTFGTVCAILVIMSISARSIADKRPRLRYVAILLGVVGLFGSKSAGSLMATVGAVAMGYTIVLLDRLRARWPGAFIPGAALVVTCIAAAGFMLPNIIIALGRNLTFSGRTDLWAAVLPLTLREPLGSGYGQSGGDAALEAITQGVGYAYRAVDSAYIVTALDLGWGFCLLFIAWLLYLIFAHKFIKSTANPNLTGVFALFMLLIGFVEKAGGPYVSLPLFALLVTETAAMRNRIKPARSTVIHRDMPKAQAR